MRAPRRRRPPLVVTGPDGEAVYTGDRTPSRRAEAPGCGPGGGEGHPSKAEADLAFAVMGKLAELETGGHRARAVLLPAWEFRDLIQVCGLPVVRSMGMLANPAATGVEWGVVV